jgi:ABC-type amino acid transport substrate-binding protein
MKFLTYISLGAFLLFGTAQAEELSIGIKEAKPFSYKEDGTWKGISVDLIKQLSKDANFKYKFVPYKDITSLLFATSENKVDISIAAISMTAERESSVDFSHSYFTTSLGILAPTKASWWDTVLWSLKKLIIIITIFVVILYIVGYMIIKIDGKENIDNLHNGAWWALVTFTTTGYGDYVPKTNKGKTFASGWMVASMFLLSIFTGYVASALTIKSLTDTPMTLSSLYNTSVVAVSGSTGQHRLTALGIKHKTVPNLDAAMKLFNDGKVKAVVHDNAMLNYTARNFDRVSVWPIKNSSEDYAIVLPQNSTLTETVNLGILKILASPEWEAIQSQYNIR